MSDFEGCINQWLHKEEVSQGLEALLLAIKDDCLLSVNRPGDRSENHAREINFINWITSEMSNRRVQSGDVE
jgi:hypothetical protein